MEGNMLYHQYLKPNSEYYGKQELTEKSNEYELNKVPHTYAVLSTSESVWKQYHVRNKFLPEQGWKIHVTSSFEESQNLLDKVAQLCLDKNIDFKHLKNKQSFIKVNSKNANRATSGKFITIYPISNEEFVELLDMISLITQDFKKGPYILSDRRWKASNVFYRYGGFSKVLNEHGEHCIRDEKGNLIIDQRTPFYQVPDFVKEFDEYLNTINLSDDLETNKESNLKRYEIETALSYSNAGGVYLARRKHDNMKVIIKEARPNAGLDGICQDALARQTNEYDALKTLQNVTGVVDFIEYFQEWEHYFLVEEFIEGRDLRQWLAQYFPLFEGSEGMNNHARKVKKILLQLLSIIEEMHNSGIAMGDLQPANVMVREDLSVRIIDFETAMPVNSENKPNMVTLGFSSQEMKVNGARDWYGMKRLVRYLALPVLTSEDLDVYLQSNHLRWIKENYESSFYHFIEDLQKKCDEKIIFYQDCISIESNLKYEKNELNVSYIINNLTKGIINNFTEDERLINGDIRQYEMRGGKFNFLTGGSGAAFTLHKVDASTSKVNDWIESVVLDNLSQVEGHGLLTGRTGILAMLYDQGYTKMVLNDLKLLKDNISETNITLRSGLSGIGLFVISVYFETGNMEYLQFAKEIAKLIHVNKKKKTSLKVNDWMTVEIGLIDGLSGVALFYSALYSATNSKEYLEKAKSLLEEDLMKTKVDDMSGVLQTFDQRNRLLPYLSGGSIGIAISIWFLNHVSGQDLYREEMEAILKLSKIRSTISGSLFDGAGSFLLLPCMVENGEAREQILADVLNLLNIFIIKKDSYYVYPGQFSYRLADDVYTGSSGIILALLGISKNNPLYWLPLVNIDNFLVKTKAKTVSEN
ncbi:class III lanthionine synthetase LanKC [Paenibacillus amylolyticus]|uniref:class III lanthionine synthetase LanKC n=1 Tax=Paenibacillus amylolyticus TaxID=1451 RepID=UPI003EB8A94C